MKKDDNSVWKIDDQLNREEFWLFDGDEFYYLPHLFDLINPYDLEDGLNSKYFLTFANMFNKLKDYYHNDFKFSKRFLDGFSPKELKTIRNGILALHGRQFKTEWLQNYFNNNTWYIPDPNYSDDLFFESNYYNIFSIKNCIDKDFAKTYYENKYKDKELFFRGFYMKSENVKKDDSKSLIYSESLSIDDHFDNFFKYHSGIHCFYLLTISRIN